MSADLRVTPKLVIPGKDLSWTAVRAAGPGGQNVNKLATKVELRFDLPGSEVLSGAVKQRLRKFAGRRLDANGCIVVVSQRTRSQPHNLELARENLADLVRSALVEPKRRRPTQPSAGSERRRLEHKRHIADKKRGRRSSSTDDAA